MVSQNRGKRTVVQYVVLKYLDVYTIGQKSILTSLPYSTHKSILARLQINVKGKALLKAYRSYIRIFYDL